MAEERPGLQVAGGMVMGCGLLTVAVALALVAPVHSMPDNCPPNETVCGEGGELSVLLAAPVALFGGVVALVGLFVRRAGQKR